MCGGLMHSKHGLTINATGRLCKEEAFYLLVEFSHSRHVMDTN